jgi:hypothetical protein
MVRKPKCRIPASSIPLMSMQVAIYSWETIARRTMMMANGTCSPAEYQKMIAEKSKAMLDSAVAMSSGNVVAALKPWHTAARASARRLRAKP